MAGSRLAWLRDAGARAVDLLFPPICVACNAEVDEVDDRICLCGSCRERMPTVDWLICKRCGARVPELTNDIADCHYCREHRLQFEETFYWGLYEGLLQDLVKSMKAETTQAVANALGSLLVREFGELLGEFQADALVPIPVHRARRYSASPGSAQALAAVVGRELGIPVRADLLDWSREVSAQVGLSQQGRFQNMYRSMRVSPQFSIDDARLLIVDDVLTTGATCSEAARVLKRAGAAEVKVLVVARAW